MSSASQNPARQLSSARCKGWVEAPPSPPAKLKASCGAVVGFSPLLGFVATTVPSGAIAGAAALDCGAVRLVCDVMLLAVDAVERLSCGVAALAADTRGSASDMTMSGRVYMVLERSGARQERW